MRDAPAAPDVRWVADRCLCLDFGADQGAVTHDAVTRAARDLRAAHLEALEDLTPAYASLLLTFDPARLDAAAAERAVRGALAAGGPQEAAPAPRRVEIPTCYAGACAPDLEAVARLTGRSPADVVRLHSGAEYVVRFLGFAPGFPYLAGLPAELDVPRLERPRARVPAGSVAVAGRQAGVYPRATPGGWRLIGRTALALFDARRTPARGGPAWLRLGDVVRFAPIEHADSHAAGGEAD